VLPKKKKASPSSSIGQAKVADVKEECSRSRAPSVGDNIQASNGAWSFEDGVAQSFPEHVKRSVPLYENGHQLIVDISDFFLPSPSRCYELGCSTGELSLKLAQHHKDRSDIEWNAIDTSEQMLAQAQQHCAQAPQDIHWHCDDICSFHYEPADMIIAYYTVQFVRPRRRQELMNKLYEALNWGGALLLFEKVRGPDARFQDLFTHLYTEFKLQGGFQPEEIVHKSRSLKGVLEPFSSQANMDLMKRAGFQDVSSIMQHLCFQGFLAIK
jgi:tRNA (cmo5U34)-methyltransferase